MTEQQEVILTAMADELRRAQDIADAMRLALGRKCLQLRKEDVGLTWTRLEEITGFARVNVRAWVDKAAST